MDCLFINILKFFTKKTKNNEKLLDFFIEILNTEIRKCSLTLFINRIYLFSQKKLRKI